MERKIKRNIYILIGLTVALLVGMVLGWFFVLVRPQREQIAQTRVNYEARLKVANTLVASLADEKKAEDRKRYLDSQLEFFRHHYRNFEFPALVPAGTEAPGEEGIRQRSDRIKTWRHYVREYYEDYGVALRDVLKAAADSADDPLDGQLFRINTAVKVDAPPKAPEDLTIPSNGLLRPTSGSNGGILGVTVVGSFAEIQKFLANVNRSPILFIVGNISLSGTSPNISASFNLTPFLIARGDGVNLSVPPAPAGGTGTPAAGAGGKTPNPNV